MLFDRRSAFLSLILIFPGNPLVLAQSASTAVSVGTGELHLRVKDPGGRALQARGILYGPVAGGSRNVRTHADGLLVVSNLPFGDYRLQLSQSGFTAETVRFQVQSASPVDRFSDCSARSSGS